MGQSITSPTVCELQILLVHMSHGANSSVTRRLAERAAQQRLPTSLLIKLLGHNLFASGMYGSKTHITRGAYSEIHSAFSTEQGCMVRAGVCSTLLGASHHCCWPNRPPTVLRPVAHTCCSTQVLA